MGTDARSVPAPDVIPEIRAVVERAKAGDLSALPRLRELLAEFPVLVAHFGNLAAQAEVGWAALAAGPDLYLRETLLARAAALRDELGGPSPSPVERLLVDRVVATWMQLNYFVAHEPEAIKAREAPRLLVFRAKRQEQAHRMHLSALAALAMVRRLLPASTPATVHAEITSEHPDGSVSGRDEPCRDDDLLAAASPLPASIQERLAGLFDQAGGDGEPVRRARRPVAAAASN